MEKRQKGRLRRVCGRAAAGASRLLPSVLLVAGAVAVAVGVGLIFPPAGVISAGALSIVGGVLLVKGGGGGE